jgi:hypothetical protein
MKKKFWIGNLVHKMAEEFICLENWKLLQSKENEHICALFLAFSYHPWPTRLFLFIKYAIYNNTWFKNIAHILILSDVSYFICNQFNAHSLIGKINKSKLDLAHSKDTSGWNRQ